MQVSSKTDLCSFSGRVPLKDRKNKGRILIVDASRLIRSVFTNILSPNYACIAVGSYVEAIQQLTLFDFDIVLTDIILPDISGIELLKNVVDRCPQTEVMIIANVDQQPRAAETLQLGASDYLIKPCDLSILERAVEQAMERSRLRAYALRPPQGVEQDPHVESHLDSDVIDCIKSILELLDLKGPQTKQHAYRTAKCATAIGKELGMDRDELQDLFLTGYLHEVAHVRIPSYLMSRAISLRGKEAALMQEQFRQGVKLIADIPGLGAVAAAISFQHDHFDGNESIDRLSGEQIPLHSRILAIANAYDEMREPLNGTAKFSHEEAVLVLCSAARRKYDPHLVSVFRRMGSERPTPGPGIDIRSILGIPVDKHSFSSAAF